MSPRGGVHTGFLIRPRRASILYLSLNKAAAGSVQLQNVIVLIPFMADQAVSSLTGGCHVSLLM